MCFTETNKSTDRENNFLWYLLCIYLDLLVIFRCFSFFFIFILKSAIYSFLSTYLGIPGNVDFSTKNDEGLINTNISRQLLVYQLIISISNYWCNRLIDKPVIVLICLSLLKNRRFQVYLGRLTKTNISRFLGWNWKKEKHRNITNRSRYIHSKYHKKLFSLSVDLFVSVKLKKFTILVPETSAYIINSYKDK